MCFPNAFWSSVSFLLAVPDGRDMINNWSLFFWKYLHICNKQCDTKVPNVNALVFSSNCWSGGWCDQISLKMKIICVALFVAHAVKHIFEHIAHFQNSQIPEKNGNI